MSLKKNPNEVDLRFEMNNEQERGTAPRIPSLAIFFVIVVASIFFMNVFIFTRILIVEVFGSNKFLFRSAITIFPGLLLQTVIFAMSQKWQRSKIQKKIVIGATPFVQQIPYFLAFIFLYSASAITFRFINDSVGVEYFSRLDPALSMNYVIGNTLILKLWDSFVRRYFAESEDPKSN